jgi:ribosomal protein S24E
MKFKITEKKENPLLERMEVAGAIEFEGKTPSNMDVIEQIAKEMGKSNDLVVMNNINITFSQQAGTFTANVYNTAEAKDKITKLTKHLRKKIEEEMKKAAEAKAKAEEEAKAAAEAKKAVEETPAEEENKEGEQ